MSKVVHQGLALLSFVAGAMLFGDRARAESYVIDPKHTEVRFAYKFGLSVHRGRFTSVGGAVEFDAKTPEKARVNAVIKTASLTTGEAMIENTLKGDEFFDTERHPEIRFQSHKVQLSGADKAQMIGTITVNGITQPITLDVSIKSGDDPSMKYRVGARRFTAIGSIRRSAFKMTAYSAMVADDIVIEIDALLKRKDPRSPAK